MNIFRKTLSIICISSIVQASPAGVYVVQNGDTLSEIAARNFNGRIYGRGGSLETLLKLNPQIQKANLIFSGDTLNISIDEKKLVHEADALNQLLPGLDAQSLPQESWNKQTFLNISPMLGYRRLDVTQNTGARATALSNFGYGINLNWQQRWDDTNTWKTALGFKIINYSFEVSGNKNLSNSDQIYSKVYISGSYGYGAYKQHTLETSIGLDREQVLRATNSTELKIESILVPSFEVNNHLTILKHKKLEGFWKAGGGVVLPSDSDLATKSSLYWQTGLGVSYRKSWGVIESGINFRSLNLELEDGTQETKDFGIILGVRFDL